MRGIFKRLEALKCSKLDFWESFFLLHIIAEQKWKQRILVQAHAGIDGKNNEDFTKDVVGIVRISHLFINIFIGNHQNEMFFSTLTEKIVGNRETNTCSWKCQDVTNSVLNHLIPFCQIYNLQRLLKVFMLNSK